MKEPSRVVTCVGGHLDGEMLVVSSLSTGLTVPIVDRHGNTLSPPRWGVYSSYGAGEDAVRWVGDVESIGDAIGLMMSAKEPPHA